MRSRKMVMAAVIRRSATRPRMARVASSLFWMPCVIVTAMTTTSARSHAGLRDVVESSKRWNSSPRHLDTLLHMNSHIFTHDNGSSPGVWLLSLGLFGNGRNAMDRGGKAVWVKPGVGFPLTPAMGCQDSDSSSLPRGAPHRK